MGSGSIAVCLGTPFDVALVRMQADSMKPLENRRNYKNVFDALITIVKTEGALKLYRCPRNLLSSVLDEICCVAHPPIVLFLTPPQPLLQPLCRPLLFHT